jgi:hypothetical protein
LWCKSPPSPSRKPLPASVARHPTKEMKHKFLLILLFNCLTVYSKGQITTFDFCYFSNIVEKGLLKTDIDNKFGNPIDSTQFKTWNDKTKQHDRPQFEYKYKAFSKYGNWTYLTVSIDENRQNKIGYIKLTIEAQSQWFLELKETKKCGYTFLKTIGLANKNLKNYYTKDKFYCTVDDLINSTKKTITIGIRND